jgi:hypothetical protein
MLFAAGVVRHDRRARPCNPLAVSSSMSSVRENAGALSLEAHAWIQTASGHQRPGAGAHRTTDHVTQCLEAPLLLATMTRFIPSVTNSSTCHCAPWLQDINNRVFYSWRPWICHGSARLPYETPSDCLPIWLPSVRTNGHRPFTSQPCRDVYATPLSRRNPHRATRLKKAQAAGIPDSLGEVRLVVEGSSTKIWRRNEHHIPATSGTVRYPA